MAEIEEMKQPASPNTLRVKLKIGALEVEFEGAAEFVQHHLDNLLGSINRSGIVLPLASSPASQEEYDFEKDLTVAGLSGPVDLASRAEEILESEFGMPDQNEEEAALSVARS